MMKSSSSESSSADPWCIDRPGHQSTRLTAQNNLHHADVILSRHEKGWSYCQDWTLVSSHKFLEQSTANYLRGDYKNVINVFGTWDCRITDSKKEKKKKTQHNSIQMCKYTKLSHPLLGHYRVVTYTIFPGTNPKICMKIQVQFNPCFMCA